MKTLTFLKRHWRVAAIAVTSVITHFLFFGHPREIVFDEIYFPHFASQYIIHSYFFDVHPPLAKLLFAAFAWLVGADPLSANMSIGNMLSDNWVLVRLLPMICGTLLSIAIYMFARRLSFSRTAAWASGMFVALENSLVVQSRFILMDSILLLCGFGGLLCFFEGRARGNKKLTYLAMVLLAFTFSIKWTGAAFIAIAFVVAFHDWMKESQKLERAGILFLQFFVIPLALYVATFALHFALLTNTGPGDSFMSPLFQKTLHGNPNEHRTDLRNSPFIEKFLELNVVLLEINEHLDATHPYSSKWYSWPLMKRGVFYWQGTKDGYNEFIYLLGNPFLYWMSSLAVALLAFYSLGRFVTKNSIDKVAFFLLFAYAINFLPFVGISRVMFLYHYQAALVFALMMLGYLVSLIPDEQLSRRTAVAFVAIAAVIFFYFAPITYGLPIKEGAEKKYFWVSTWR